jgi:preprotein translocase subunit YajC
VQPDAAATATRLKAEYAKGTKLMDWFTAKAALGLARWAWGLIVLIVVVIAIFALIHFIQARPKQEAKVAQNQTQAAQANGTDAVNAVGAVGQRTTAEDDLTRSNQKDIDNAKGSDAAVDPASRDAALRSLCHRRAYSGDPKCVRFAAP